MAVLFLRGTFFGIRFILRDVDVKEFWRGEAFSSSTFTPSILPSKNYRKPLNWREDYLPCQNRVTQIVCRKLLFIHFLKKLSFFYIPAHSKSLHPYLIPYLILHLFSSLAQSAGSGLQTSKNYQKRIISTNRPLEFLLQKKDQIHPFTSVETTPDIVLVVA